MPLLCISCVLSLQEMNTVHVAVLVFVKNWQPPLFCLEALEKNVICSRCKTVSKCLCIRRATPKRNADVHIQKLEA